MATVSVEVDLDIDEFETDELLSEIDHRYSSSRATKEDKQEIEEFITDFKFSFSQDAPPRNNSLLDQMKIDFLIKNLDRIKLNDLENLI